MQDKIYKKVWLGLVRAKSQLMTIKRLSREIHKRKVTKFNQRVRFFWIKCAFPHRFELVRLHLKILLPFFTVTLNSSGTKLHTTLITFAFGEEFRSFCADYAYIAFDKKKYKIDYHASICITCDKTDSVERYQ